MRLIENSFENHPYANDKILDTEVTWSAFCRAINKEILDGNVRMTSSEDISGGGWIGSKFPDQMIWMVGQCTGAVAAPVL